jgi:hypothetical protein
MIGFHFLLSKFTLSHPLVDAFFLRYFRFIIRQELRDLDVRFKLDAGQQRNFVISKMLGDVVVIPRRFS